MPVVRADCGHRASGRVEIEPVAVQRDEQVSELIDVAAAECRGGANPRLPFQSPYRPGILITINRLTDRCGM